MKRRDPSDDERALWRETTKHDVILGEAEPRRGSQATAPDSRRIDDAPRMTNPSRKPRKLPPLTPEKISDTDGNTARKLKRGELPIDATLDLHGLSEAQAFDQLHRRMRAWSMKGARCVCIITGKGRGGEGVLKRALPRWLNDEPLRSLVVTLSPAPQRLGGEGALLVLLKRMR